MQQSGISSTAGRFDGLHRARGLQLVGMLLLLLGLQAWVFSARQSGLSEAAESSLVTLRQEFVTDRQFNTVLTAMQQLWRARSDAVRKDELLELRDAVLERYPQSRTEAVHEIERAVANFEAASTTETDSLAELRSQVATLSSVYADRTGEALSFRLRPPWYLRPGAYLAKGGRNSMRALQFNHALAQAYRGDAAGAKALLDKLRQDSESQYPPGDVLFALARLRYDTFLNEGDPAYFREALDLARQSVGSDAKPALPKLLLDYLLSVNLAAATAELAPDEGQGVGEGQGDRGMLTPDPGEF